LHLTLELFKIQVQVSSASSNARCSQEPPDQSRLNSYLFILEIMYSAFVWSLTGARQVLCRSTENQNCHNCWQDGPSALHLNIYKHAKSGAPQLPRLQIYKFS